MELVQELNRMHYGRSDLSLMAYRDNSGWQVWARGQEPTAYSADYRWWPRSGRTGVHDWYRRSLQYTPEGLGGERGWQQWRSEYMGDIERREVVVG